MPFPASYTRENDEPARAPVVFGTQQRTRLLLLIAILEETYTAELSRYGGSSISSVQLTLDIL